MAKFSLAFEGQEQDLDMGPEMITDEYDSLDNTVMSPVASAAFNGAVEDSETLSRINGVLEGADVDNIPESSRQVIQTAMESIRARLLGDSQAPGVAVEGFASKSALNVAIEENKNILARVWGAIVDFFMGILNFVLNFFKSKEQKIKEEEENQHRLENAAFEMSEDIRELEKFSVNSLKGSHFDLKVKEHLKNNKTVATFEDGTLINEHELSDGLEDSSDRNNRMAELLQILKGNKGIVLVTSNYNGLFGSDDIKVKVNNLLDLTEMVKSYSKVQDKLEGAGLDGILDLPLSKEVFDRVTKMSIEELMGEPMAITPGTKIVSTGNSSKIERINDSEINVTITGTIQLVKELLKTNRQEIKTVKDLIKETWEISSTISNKIHDYGKKIDIKSESQEAQDQVNSVKAKINFINAFLKLIVLTANEISKLLGKTNDFIEAYMASLHMVMRQMVKK